MQKQFSVILNYLKVISLLLLLILMIFSCKTITESKYGAISGKVILINDSKDRTKDPVDYSGVTVALYNLASLDTTIVRINQEYPNIGVQISQETEFDHREQNPLKIVQTNSDGSFLISKVKAGTYNLAFIKEGWTIKYLYNIEIGENETENLQNIILKNAIYLNGLIDQPIEFTSDRLYIVSENIDIVSTAVLKPNAIIAVAPNKRVNFYGGLDISLQDDSLRYWKVIAGNNIYSYQKTTIDTNSYYNCISINQPNIILKNGVIKHIKNALGLYAQNSNVYNMYFFSFGYGLNSSQSNMIVSNVLFSKGTRIGLQIIGTEQDANIVKCIFNDQNDGIVVYTGLGYNISKTYFINCKYAIRPQDCVGTISNNNFDRNEYDIKQYRCNCTIQYNNFYHSLIQGISPTRITTVNYNNFFRANHYMINIRGGAPTYSTVSGDMDATNNYWAVSDIDAYILDSNDNALYPNQNCLYRVIYIPKRNTRIHNAGITIP